ncbi:WD repeat-containing protein-like protein [Delitschia confertaspora ATCC 74209]|uniref:WD repeat-containing protein-like protein n=1 Tax=Delitschia confertaspora ATCC 74209 TaxID=1513339 RepID=A0A9P4JG75_9PLEO|nr:WD repeat-containing protein-like protein [Delitschia confertaspora ATCC 74209]
MRLDNDPSNRSQSPTQNFGNGSSRSPRHRTNLGKSKNGDSYKKPESNGSVASYSNGSPISNGRPIPTTYFGHDRDEVTRILIQSLTDLGYHGAAAALNKESGCELEGPTVAAFRTAVIEGRWAEAEALLFGAPAYEHGGGINLDGHGNYGKSSAKSKRQSWSDGKRPGGLPLSEGANRDEMKFRIREQKYLELLECRDLGNALMVLRQELTPLRQDEGRVHALSSLLMCGSTEDLKSQAQWDGAEGQSRTILLSELSKSISPSVMIPEHRLANLLDQVKKNWISNCLYHTTTAAPSLYVDHCCERENFPLNAVLELRHHKDQIWYLKYSNDGTKLAATGKDNTIVIYETETYKPLQFLAEHEAGVSYVAWSPDDSKVISCCRQQENSARIWDVQTGRCLSCISDFTYPVTAAQWAPDGNGVVIGSQDTHCALALWDPDEGNVIYKWKRDNMRVNDLAISPDGSYLAVALNKPIILIYDFATRELINEIKYPEIKGITSVSISQDSQHMLVSMVPDKLVLFKIDTGEPVQEYEGEVLKNFVVRSTFGGANDGFVVSGSEDSRVYIWRTNGSLVEALDAHPGGCVNAVAWHPKDPRTFATAGDDEKVRIWKPAQSHPLGSYTYSQ